MDADPCLHGATWDEVKRLIHSRARYWYGLFKDGQTYQDFVFAGWYGTALAIRSYDTARQQAEFRTYLGHRIDGEMMECHRRWVHARRTTRKQVWPRVVWRTWETPEGLERMIERTLIHQAAPFVDRQQAIRATMRSLTGRHAEMFFHLCAGKNTFDLMEIFGVGQARISQLFGELRAIFAEHL